MLVLLAIFKLFVAMSAVSFSVLTRGPDLWDLGYLLNRFSLQIHITCKQYCVNVVKIGSSTEPANVNSAFKRNTQGCVTFSVLQDL